MPVSPVPCPPEGGSTPIEVTTCCSPSISSTPLCRADGTMILAIVRSGCVDCGETPEAPAVVGWIDPASGAFTAGAIPAGAEPCALGCSCSPSIATATMCLDDGTSILVVVRSECADCDTPAPDPVVVGWINPTTGVFTPGAIPAGAGPCTTDCIDTICRQRCDDTDGDGAPNATYSELWCIRLDGSAELVLTYQDDPSVPYTPVAPVDCTYGCPESETVTLCDANGPFLRRYTWLDGVASYVDYALDGATPHVVIGTVGVCDSGTSTPGAVCAEQTTPAATVGLCLADGTPIAVVITRDCDTDTVTQEGWLNLATGAYSAGDPPAGTVACGDSRSIQVSGTFCDVLPDGTVAGLVLVEYSYDDTGAIASVRLVDAVTGTTYVPTGEVTTCPAGVEQPERDLVQLCDTATDGTVTPFVRDFARSETGAITGHGDYRLDGTPYTPTGTVGVCPTESTCLDCSTHLLCDTNANPPATIAGTPASGTLPNGVTYAVTAPSPFPPGRQSDGAAWWGTALFPNPNVPLTRWTFNQPVTVEFSVAMVYSTTGTAPGENTVQLPPGAVPLSLPTGYSYNQTTRILRADNTLTGCTLNSPTRAASARFRVVGVTTFTLQYLGSRTLNIPCQRFGNWEFGALDVSLGGPFLRTVCRDCAGAVTTVADRLLDGTTSYTPTGAVGVCSSADDSEETCSNSTALLLCDLPDDVDPSGEPVAGDTAQQFIADLVNADFVQRPGGGAALWSGGTIAFGAEAATGPGITQVHRYVAATLQADARACNAGTARLVLSVDVENLGPGTGCSGAGRFRLFHTDGSVLAAGQSLLNTPVGVPQTLVIAADVPAADLAAGDVAVWLDVETYQSGLCPPPDSKSWEAGNFTATYEYDTAGCGTQFLRTVVTDCETGTVLAVSDSTLEGDPYTVTGEVGQCSVSGSGGTVTTGMDVEVVALCDTDGSGVVTAFLRRLAYASDGSVDTVTDTGLDGVTPYTATGTVGVCAPAAEECRTTTTVQLCDIAATESVTLLDPTNVLDADDWQVTAFTGSQPGYGPPSAMPYDAFHRINGSGIGQLSSRPDFNVGPPTVPWPGYDAAPISWTLSKTFTLTVGGMATVTMDGFKGDHGARVRINGQDLGLYAQYNQPVDGDQFTIPVNVGTNTIQIEDHDINHVSYIQGTIALTVSGETQFLRHLVMDCETGEVIAVTDTTLDGAPYGVLGTAGQCTLPVDEEPGDPAAPCMAQSVIQQCRCDDTDSDGIADTDYVELYGVDCTGALTSLGTYTDDLCAPYEPVAPIDCGESDAGADPVTGVQARRIELTAGQTWDAAAWPTLQSVTAVAHGASGSVTTEDGSSTLFAGEAATWSVGREADALLAGLLVITAGTGAVTVSWTCTVAL